MAFKCTRCDVEVLQEKMIYQVAIRHKDGTFHWAPVCMPCSANETKGHGK